MAGLNGKIYLKLSVFTGVPEIQYPMVMIKVTMFNCHVVKLSLSVEKEKAFLPALAERNAF